MSDTQTATTTDQQASSDQAATSQTQTTQAATTALPVTPDFRTYLNEKGEFTAPDWAGPDHPGIAKKFTSMQSLVKSYATLERLNMSSNKIAVPTATSTPEEVEAFYSKVRGVSKADEYELPVPEELKDVAMDANSVKAFQEVAYKNGVSKQAMAELASLYYQQTGQALKIHQEAKQQAVEQATKSLKDEWKGEYDANLKLAEVGASISGLTPEILKSTPELSNNPHFIKAMAKIAGMVKEGPAAGLRNGQPELGQDIAGQIRAIMTDQKNPYWIKGHPDQKRMVEKVAALNQMLYPEPKQ